MSETKFMETHSGMRAELAEQRGMLEKELGNLDALLASDADWQALLVLEAQRARVLGDKRLIDLQMRGLRTKLSGNRIYCARERIVEAIQLIAEEQEHEPVPKATEPVAVAVSKPESKPEPVVRRRETVKVTSKVTVHATPPDGMRTAGVVGGAADDLTKIRGLSPEVAVKLNSLGVRRYDQIAQWSARDVASVRAALGLGNQIARENWIERAASLAAPLADSGDDRVVEPALQAPVVQRELEPEPEVDASLAVSAAAASVAASIAVVKVPPVTIREDAPEPSRVADAASAILARLGETDHVETPSQAPAVSAPEVAESEESTASSITECAPELPVEAAAGARPVTFTAGAGALMAASLAAATPTSKRDGGRTGQRDEAPADPLESITSIDAAMAERLKDAGITRFSQIALWSPQEVATISVALKVGRKIARDAWVEQAAILAGGGTTAYSRHRLNGEPVQAGALIDWRSESDAVRLVPGLERFEVAQRDVTDETDATGSDVAQPGSPIETERGSLADRLRASKPQQAGPPPLVATLLADVAAPVSPVVEVLEQGVSVGEELAQPEPTETLKSEEPISSVTAGEPDAPRDVRSAGHGDGSDGTASLEDVDDLIEADVEIKIVDRVTGIAGTAAASGPDDLAGEGRHSDRAYDDALDSEAALALLGPVDEASVSIISTAGPDTAAQSANSNASGSGQDGPGMGETGGDGSESKGHARWFLKSLAGK